VDKESIGAQCLSNFEPPRVYVNRNNKHIRPGFSLMSVYLDCNATTPIEPEVESELLHFVREEFGNAGSRTHEFGARAKKAVEAARDRIAKVVNASREEVIFTSGATESNNIAILGLLDHGLKSGKTHIVSTGIEHKAVLEPLDFARRRGFDVTLIAPEKSGAVSAAVVKEALRPETLLVSVMHVNNETGVVQPISRIAQGLEGHDAFFHVDAAQGFGKIIDDLRSRRIDLLSVSGHKIYAPKGVGSLVVRRRGFSRPPLTPLTFGGGQERGLRPGTLPVALIAALGRAAEIAVRDLAKRVQRCTEIKEEAMRAVSSAGGIPNGDQSMVIASTLNVAFPGIDSEALMVALKDLIAVSNGSACTSQNYEPSHVLKAMNLPDDQIKGALRLSWSHLTPNPPWEEVVKIIRALN
jgi:cysteine desulfurase